MANIPALKIMQNKDKSGPSTVSRYITQIWDGSTSHFTIHGFSLNPIPLVNIGTYLKITSQALQKLDMFRS